MEVLTLAVGSLDTLVAATGVGGVIELSADADVVIVPTASAFSGLAEAAWAIAEALANLEVRVEALMVADRTSSGEPHFVQRLHDAELVVLCDGSPLHARAVWRETPVGEAINAARRVVAIGSVATVVGDQMIDPRGGAPTTGLGYRTGLVITTPMSDEQTSRTRTLVGPDHLLCVVGHDDAVGHDEHGWRVVLGAPVVTRGHDVVAL
jgi:cyanophycinase-like exopeptidase